MAVGAKITPWVVLFFFALGVASVPSRILAVDTTYIRVIKNAPQTAADTVSALDSIPNPVRTDSLFIEQTEPSWELILGLTLLIIGSAAILYYFRSTT